MSHALDLFLDHIAQAGTEKEIEDALRRFVVERGWTYFHFVWSCGAASQSCVLDPTGSLGNFPAEFLRRYVDARYYEDDRVNQKCANGVLPVVWGEACGEQPGPRQRRIAREAALHGLVSGVSAPVHGPGNRRGVLSVARFRPGAPEMTQPQAVRDLHMAALHLHDTIWRQADSRQTRPDAPSLKPNETACLSWAARGKSSREIGALSGVS
ncbi:MAG: autoinducer binding domain-containing protein, partial [Alphaproteobacteria bacterium]|nr:autoinducer binding domain-containing protein [Alphaproteobacteria bacterium]